ncbi:HDOD domain-containing protein [Gilvimarinus agarilyticus]|uniref:aminoacyl-tRNA deacylase and HDOD domain-containing protein n=1 Tax=unclassified Gilvimarinus TaxID=2642066 RepID=UPI001C092A09|nr:MULTISPECIES: HDOD domain-containing protein [unclassified Gilvimarinus]MBU2884524.1 HDOD domain-containing protein [Gilvimarinus agarilyticus]MDO6569653.1 HDOD domain-containing protein [Gilvimarinus sp. 2_MG-2023]MDO6748020.1 HDOD domain-containing protein [Gilvimarinus sp. 1_MG-2023]
MPVPTSVESLLSSQNIRYDLAATPNDNDNRSLWHDQHLRNVGAAKSILLQDEVGRVQVVIAANTLLDLNAVSRQLNRELQAASAQELKQFCDANHFQSVPALPQVAGLLTLVDQALLDRDELLLDSGDNEQLIHVQSADFQQTLNDAIVCDISVPLAPLEADNSQADDLANINSAIQNFTQMRIKQRLEETLELPPLSDTAQRIIKLRVDPNADISDLAQIVETDPSLAAQVVSWAASPYYSAPGKIKSIHDAIVRVLGFDMVLNLALGLALGKTISMPKDSPNGELAYWHQSVYMAATIEGLVTAIPRDQRPSFGMAYLTGLLHNFGMLVMAEVFPPHYTKFCRLSEANPHTTPQAIERHILGMTRDQVAGCLMELWSMPEEVVVGIRHQQNPEITGEHAIYAKLIYIAKCLLRQHGIGNGPKVDIPQSLLDELHLNKDKAEATVANIIESTDELEHIASALSPS